MYALTQDEREAALSICEAALSICEAHETGRQAFPAHAIAQRLLQLGFIVEGKASGSFTPTAALLGFKGELRNAYELADKLNELTVAIKTLTIAGALDTELYAVKQLLLRQKDARTVLAANGI